MTIQIEDMNWSIYADTSIDSPEDTTTSAPDGDYKVRTEMFDYRAANNNEWPPKQDYVFLGWESDYTVSVKNGHINKTQALKAAGHLMGACGYHGRYVEALDFKPDSNTFQLTVGS